MACGLKFRVYLPVTSLVKLLYIALCNKAFNTMHKLFAFLTLLCLCGCLKEQDAVIELENSKVYFIHFSSQTSYSEAEREKSTTVLNFTFSNPTHKKLLFIFDKQNLYPFNQVPDGFGDLQYVIKDKNDSLVKLSQPMIHYATTMDDCFYEGRLYEHNRKYEKYKAFRISGRTVEIVDNYIKNSFVLHPGEKRKLKLAINLPILIESHPKMQNNPAYYKNLREGYTFQLFYKCNANELKGSLPKYLRDELEQNEVEIYDGILYSNTATLVSKN
jgi:hypothetical protein